MSFLRTFLALAAASSVVACGGGLKLKPIRNSETRPSNVAAYFKVEKSNGEPVGGLSADKFKIYEDGQLVSEFESKQVILNPEVAASHYTMLLVDMSGSISDSGAIDSVVDAAADFTERVEKSQRVGVYAFDGCGKLHAVAPFTSPGGATAAVRSLKGYKPDDPSTDLHGAIVKGIEEMDSALAKAPNPMRFGTIVVFTDGSDRAARVSNDDMKKALKDTDYEIFAIGLGAEMKDSELKKIGKTGTAHADDKEEVLKAFDTIAQRIESSTKAYYLLSYCSPARAGKHKLKIEAEATDENGKSKKTGSFESEFDATGFAKGCDPNTPPNFDTSKGDALAPAKPKPEQKAEAKAEARPAAAKPKPKAATSSPNALPPPPPPKNEEAFSP
jgi:hypothetical protein